MKVPREISRKENRERYAGMLAYSKAYSDYHIARTFDAASHFYGGVDPLRRKEMAAGGMVREDHNAFANCSPIAVHAEYPDRYAVDLSPFIDDTILD